MTFKPAHKDTDTPPGQIVNSVSVPETPRSKTISSIIDRVMRSEAPPNFWHSEEKAPKKKLTFDEWSDLNQKEIEKYPCSTEYGGDVWYLLEFTWKAAQENA